MPNPVFNGAFNGAIVGAVSGGLLWVVLKVFKLDHYLGAKEPASPLSPSAMDRPGLTPRSFDVAAPPPTQTTLIAVMWALTILAMLLGARASQIGPWPLLLDVPAFVLAIVLLCKPGATNKWNGGAKLVLEVVAFFVAFTFALHATPVSPAMLPQLPAMPQTMDGPPNWPQPQGHIVAPPQFHAPPAPPMPPAPFGPR